MSNAVEENVNSLMLKFYLFIFVNRTIAISFKDITNCASYRKKKTRKLLARNYVYAVTLSYINKTVRYTKMVRMV